MDPIRPADIVVYWRPGCGFCSALRRTLRRAGLVTQEINIWQDRDGAAFVRSVAGGNETVPTVVIGARAFVNPAPGVVLETVRREAPDLLPDEPEAGRARHRWWVWLTGAR